jgi:hypothetical protein
MAIQKRRFSLTTVFPAGKPTKDPQHPPEFQKQDYSPVPRPKLRALHTLLVKVPVGYPSSRVDVADFGRPFRDFGPKTKIRPKVPPPKNLGLMLGFLETGEVFVRAGG